MSQCENPEPANSGQTQYGSKDKRNLLASCHRKHRSQTVLDLAWVSCSFSPASTAEKKNPKTRRLMILAFQCIIVENVPQTGMRLSISVSSKQCRITEYVPQYPKLGLRLIVYWFLLNFTYSPPDSLILNSGCHVWCHGNKLSS